MTEILKTSEWAWKDIDWKTATPADIKKVIAAGGKVNDVAWEGDASWRDVNYTEHTPLELAVRAINVPAVKFLLGQKADPNVVLASRSYHWGDSDIHDYPLLSTAIRFRNQEIIDLFFAHGADPYAFDPTQKPKRVLRNHMHGLYVNTNEPLNGWDEHPLSAAIESGNLEVVKKLTSDPYTVSETLMQKIETGYPKTDATEYWEAFIDRETRKKRRGLRGQLAEAHRQKDAAKKEEIISKLVGVRPTRIETGDERPPLSRYFEMSKKSPEEREALRKGKRIPVDPKREAEAEEFKALKRKYDSKTAIAAHKAMKAKRDKLLGK